MAAPTQLQLSQHGVDAEDFRPLQYVSARDSVLPPQHQYPSKTAKVEAIEPARLLHVHRPSLCSIRQRREDDGLKHLQFRAEFKTVTISNCVLKTTEGVTGLGNPTGHFVLDFGAAGEGTAQIRGVVHDLQLGSVHADLRLVVDNVGWRLVHIHRLLRVNDQIEVVAGGGEEVHASLHVLFQGGVEGAVVGEEKFVDGGCGYTRLEVQPSVVAEVVVHPVGDADPRAFVTLGVHQHGREHKIAEGGREDAALLHFVGHCECLRDSTVVREACHHASSE
ncbi:hypothetical protein SprV_0602204800 [Sparganum proliferum]